MLVSVDTYRTVSGDTTSSDAQITASLTRVQSLIEGYTERSLEQAERTETHLYVGPEPVLLKEWPVASVTSIDKDGSDIDPTTVLIDKAKGIIHHKNQLIWGENVEVTYTAGYATCPEDLKHAICDLVTSHLAGELSITGPDSARPVKRETVYGVSAIEYDAFAVNASRMEFYPELGAYTRILDRYRRPYEVPTI